jgi:hypothetical protein
MIAKGMIIKITFATEDSQAAFDLAGTPNGTCTSSFGSQWFPRDPVYPLILFCFLDESSHSVQHSIRTNFSDIWHIGLESDISNVSIIQEFQNVPYSTALGELLYRCYC